MMDRTKLNERRFEFQARALPAEGEGSEELWAVSYTHLDVYKRQYIHSSFLHNTPCKKEYDMIHLNR